MLGLRKGECGVGGGGGESQKSSQTPGEQEDPGSLQLSSGILLVPAPHLPSPLASQSLMVMAQAQEQGLHEAATVRRPETEPRAQFP